MSPSYPQKIAVIIVNYNGGDYLIRCLKSVREQTYPIWRIILVDNASQERPIHGNEEWLMGVQYIPLESNIGFAAANNLAVKIAEEAEWIALLNPDAFAEPHWLKNLILAAERFPEYSSFASRMLCADDPHILDGAGDSYYLSGRVKRRGHLMPEKGLYLVYDEVFSPCGGAALYKRSAFNEAGGFDEDFFCYLEDIDLGFRLRLLGYRCLYVPHAVVLHVGSGTTGRNSDFATYYGHRNLVWVYFKNMPSVLFWRYLPLMLVMNIAGVIKCALRGQTVLACKAKVDALKGIVGVLSKRKLIRSTHKNLIFQ